MNTAQPPAPIDTQGSRNPPLDRDMRQARILFWASTALWVTLCILTTQIVPILNAIRPSFQVGLTSGLCVMVGFIGASNFTALYGLARRRNLLSSAPTILAWLAAAAVAVLSDLGVALGILRLVFLGPSILPFTAPPPSEGLPPALTPALTVSPPPSDLPEGFESISDAYVHLEFVLPAGWARKEDSSPGAVSVEYAPPQPNTYPVFRAGADSEPGLTPSIDDIMSSNLSGLRSSTDAVILSQYETSIAGNRSLVLEYTLDRPSTTYFSIIALVMGPDSRAYILQWTSSAEDQSSARSLFEEMLPYFQFLP